MCPPLSGYISYCFIFAFKAVIVYIRMSMVLDLLDVSLHSLTRNANTTPNLELIVTSVARSTVPSETDGLLPKKQDTQTWAFSSLFYASVSSSKIAAIPFCWLCSRYLQLHLVKGEPEIDILTTGHQIAASDCRWTSIKSDFGAGVDWKYPIGRLKVPDRW